MPVCITGIHRAGLSTVADTLKNFNLHIPPADEPGHTQFLRLNDELLMLLGGSYENLPVIESDWSGDPRFDSLRDRARDMIGGFDEHSMWGWVDPRTAVTVEFWQGIAPDLKIVFSVDDPSTVDRAEGWLNSYFDAAQNCVNHSGCIVTHHDSLVSAPTDELRRVVDFLGLPVMTETLSKAGESIENGGHAITENSLPVLESLRGNYYTLASKAGYVFTHVVLSRQSERTVESDLVAVYRREIETLSARLKQMEQEINNLEQTNRKLHMSQEDILTVEAQLEIARLMAQVAELQEDVATGGKNTRLYPERDPSPGQVLRDAYHILLPQRIRVALRNMRHKLSNDE